MEAEEWLSEARVGWLELCKVLLEVEGWVFVSRFPRCRDTLLIIRSLVGGECLVLNGLQTLTLDNRLPRRPNLPRSTLHPR